MVRVLVSKYSYLGPYYRYQEGHLIDFWSYKLSWLWDTNKSRRWALTNFDFINVDWENISSPQINELIITLMCQNISVQAVLSIGNYENFMFLLKSTGKMNWNLKKRVFLWQLKRLEYNKWVDYSTDLPKTFCRRRLENYDILIHLSCDWWKLKWNLVRGTGYCRFNLVTPNALRSCDQCFIKSVNFFFLLAFCVETKKGNTRNKNEVFSHRIVPLILSSDLCQTIQ